MDNGTADAEEVVLRLPEGQESSRDSLESSIAALRQSVSQQADANASVAASMKLLTTMVADLRESQRELHAKMDRMSKVVTPSSAPLPAPPSTVGSEDGGNASGSFPSLSSGGNQIGAPRSAMRKSSARLTYAERAQRRVARGQRRVGIQDTDSCSAASDVEAAERSGIVDDAGEWSASSGEKDKVVKVANESMPVRKQRKGGSLKVEEEQQQEEEEEGRPSVNRIDTDVFNSSDVNPAKDLPMESSPQRKADDAGFEQGNGHLAASIKSSVRRSTTDGDKSRSRSSGEPAQATAPPPASSPPPGKLSQLSQQQLDQLSRIRDAEESKFCKAFKPLGHAADNSTDSDLSEVSSLGSVVDVRRPSVFSTTIRSNASKDRKESVAVAANPLDRTASRTSTSVDSRKQSISGGVLSASGTKGSKWKKLKHSLMNPMVRGALVQKRRKPESDVDVLKESTSSDHAFKTSASSPTSMHVGHAGHHKKGRHASLWRTLDKWRINPTSYLGQSLDFMYIAILLVHLLMELYILVAERIKTATTAHYAVNAVLSALLLLWTGSKFFTQMQGRAWAILDHPYYITRKYLRTWFPFDFFIAFPIEFIFLSHSVLAYRILSLRHFLMVIRVPSLLKPVNPLQLTVLSKQFVAFMCVFIAVHHVFACVFLDREPGMEYVDALYWSAMTLTSVGYGDVSVSTRENRWMAIVGMITGVCTVASFTAMATKMLTSRDAVTAERETKSSILHSMLQHYKIPWKLQKQVIYMFPAVAGSDLELQFQEMVKKFPPFVASELLAYVNVNMLRSVPFFDHYAENEELLLEMAKVLAHKFVPAQDTLIEAGTSSDEMFFLVHGTVALLHSSMAFSDLAASGSLTPKARQAMSKRSRGSEEATTDDVAITMTDGAFFGEEAILQDDFVSLVSVCTVTPCELFVMTREAFSNVTYDEDVKASLVNRIRRGSVNT